MEHIVKAFKQAEEAYLYYDQQDWDVKESLFLGGDDDIKDSHKELRDKIQMVLMLGKEVSHFNNDITEFHFYKTVMELSEKEREYFVTNTDRLTKFIRNTIDGILELKKTINISDIKD